MKTTLDEMQAFLAVIDSGSISAAAEQLGQTPSGVSRALGRLEDKLGTTLLTRTTRRLHLTAEGEAYLRHARAIIDAVESAEEQMAARRERPAGRLRVDAAMPFVLHVIAPLVAGYRARYPEVQLELNSSERYIDLLERRTDLAIRIGALPDSSLHARPLCHSWRRVLASPGYLARHGTPKHPRDIVERKMPVACYFSASSGVTQPLRFQRGNERITLEGVVSDVLVSDSSAQLATALAGMGLVHTLDFMVRPAIEQGTLVPILARWRPEPTQVYAAYPPSRRFSTKVRVFVDWAATLFNTP